MSVRGGEGSSTGSRRETGTCWGSERTSSQGNEHAEKALRIEGIGFGDYLGLPSGRDDIQSVTQWHARAENSEGR